MGPSDELGAPPGTFALIHTRGEGAASSVAAAAAEAGVPTSAEAPTREAHLQELFRAAGLIPEAAAAAAAAAVAVSKATAPGGSPFLRVWAG